jgi:hypothetical protein
MTEHNLPEKDDAPWLDTTYDGFNEEQIKMLRRLIQDEIKYAQIDGMEHGQWGWAEKQLDEGWKRFQESFDD